MVGHRAHGSLDCSRHSQSDGGSERHRRAAAEQDFGGSSQGKAESDDQRGGSTYQALGGDAGVLFRSSAAQASEHAAFGADQRLLESGGAPPREGERASRSQARSRRATI